jgi:hypothetical protein
MFYHCDLLSSVGGFSGCRNRLGTIRTGGTVLGTTTPVVQPRLGLVISPPRSRRRNARGTVLIIAALFFWPLSLLVGQEVWLLIPGFRVRITAADLGIRQQVGTLVTPCGDTLVISGSNPNSTLRVPCTSLTAVDISSGQKSGWAEGLGLGLFVGAATGAILGAACCRYGDVVVVAAPFFAGMGAAGGAFLGMLIGSNVHTERWRHVPLKQVRVGFEPRFPNRLGIKVALVL